MSRLVRSQLSEPAFDLVGAAEAASFSAGIPGEELAASAAPTRAGAEAFDASNTSSAADNSSVVQPVVAMIFGSPSITPPARSACSSSTGPRSRAAPPTYDRRAGTEWWLTV